MTGRFPRTLSLAVVVLIAAVVGTAIADQGPTVAGSGKAATLAKKASEKAKQALEIAQGVEQEPGPPGEPGAPGTSGERGPSGVPLSAQASLVADDAQTLLEVGNVRLLGYCLKDSLGLPTVLGWVGVEVDEAGPQLVLDNAPIALAPGTVVLGNAIAAGGPAFGPSDGATRSFTILDGTKSVSGVASAVVNVPDDECHLRVHAFV